MNYYVNDGIFGSFNCKIFDHIDPIGEPLHETTGPEFPTTIWGPTCDSIDKIETRKLMPRLKKWGLDLLRYDGRLHRICSIDFQWIFEAADFPFHEPKKML
ncbi:unnamed protein product [Caenorhabditis auriculariae]|uniref:Orn/DAP/Arg decarboxylase 2 C-terminal domain-containing protein n=1 Tax=Caenorhabditis auriculariae TaxID=2777116 RepID=A0A8S1HSG5_9PELO|nr:unnamed protein product [Caenorhabditis auriculariae]